MASDTELCEGDQLTLTTETQTGTNVTYDWFKDGEFFETTDEPVIVIDDPMSGSYSVLVQVDDCAFSSSTVNVTVATGPDASDDTFSGEAGTIITGNILANDDPGGGVTITVNQPGNGSVTVDENGNMTYTPNAGFVGTDQYSYTICLVDCPELCDEATVTITLTVEECIVPNIITPNGDGVNDDLVIDCLTDGNFPNNSIRIFNRWGDEIFVAEPYQNDWEGTYGDDNDELPAATYFYMLKLDKNSDEVMAGYITLVR
jgi:gliding motility-associated-like protein